MTHGTAVEAVLAEQASMPAGRYAHSLSLQGWLGILMDLLPWHVCLRGPLQLHLESDRACHVAAVCTHPGCTSHAALPMRSSCRAILQWLNSDRIKQQRKAGEQDR